MGIHRIPNLSPVNLIRRGVRQAGSLGVGRRFWEEREGVLEVERGFWKWRGGSGSR